MTLETRTTITLGDVAAIEYECAHCRSRTIRLLDDQHSVPLRCGNCSSLWFADNSNEHNDLKLLVSTLRDIPKSSINQHVTIRLEIRQVIPPKST